MEQVSGLGRHDIITVVMNEKGVDIDGAFAWVGNIMERYRTKGLEI